MATDFELQLNRLEEALRELEREIARLEAVPGSGGQSIVAWWEDNP